MASFVSSRRSPAVDAAVLSWAAVIWAVPWVAAHAPSMAPLVGAIYVTGSIICHQLPERSFHIAGAQLPVCARCTGLYLSAAMGLAGFRMWRSVWRSSVPGALRAARCSRALVFTSLPTVFTLTTAAVGWWDPPNAVRFLSALPLGACAGAVLAAAAVDDLM